MANTSATGGFLTPSATPVQLEDDALVNFLQEWVVGITGLTATLVRPRWQPEPPDLPDTTWVALGIVSREAETFASEQHFTTGNGYNEVKRHEVLNLLASFYGPQANLYLSNLREGMAVAQNREILSVNSMGLIGCGDSQALPELVKEKWLYRIDLPFSIRRQIIRDYPVLQLTSGNVTLNNEHYTESITITQ